MPNSDWKRFVTVEKRFFRYLKPYKWMLFGALLATAVASFLQLTQAVFIKWIMALLSEDSAVDVLDRYSGLAQTVQDIKAWFPLDFSKQPIIEVLQAVCIAFLVLMFIRVVGVFLNKLWVSWATVNALKDLRLDLFQKMQSFEVAFFRQESVGKVVQRLTTDMQVAGQCYLLLSDLVKYGVIVVLGFGLMIYRDWQMTLLLMLVAPIVGLALGKFGSYIFTIAGVRQAKEGVLQKFFVENIMAQPIVQSFSLQEEESDRCNVLLEDLKQEQKAFYRLDAMRLPVIEYVSLMTLITIIYLGVVRMINSPDLGLAEASEFWAYLIMTIEPAKNLTTIFSSFQESAAAAERVFAYLDRVPLITSGEKKLREPIQGGIIFDKVDFSYDGHNKVLKDISFTINPGETVAFVGPNGAGKSSLLQLIPRLYQPDSGRLLFDGVPVEDLILDDLRSQIAVVTQESILFAGTIEYNIRLGRPDATNDEIREAARLSSAARFIDDLPNAYETQVGERGESLSGGQRQRVAIARALLRKPKVLILDEYTAGVDTDSEKLIAESLAQAAKDITCLIIAHRYATIEKADRVVVLDQGELVEQGTLSELQKSGGVFQRLYESS